jgi:cytochrome P450|tara:strand:- start:331 stop:1551 length:1221 start_codon:yes stop_codon:yes gene_type:complete
MDYKEITKASMWSNVDNAHVIYTDMRKNDPVSLIETDEYKPFWAVSKHADIIEVERQHEKFLNTQNSVLIRRKDEEIRAANPAQMRTLINMDGVEHAEFRRLTQDWFLPQNLKTLEAKVTQIAETFVDRMLATGGECDFVSDVAIWYPLRVIMMILGVPEEDEALMLKLTQEIFGSEDPDMQRKGTDEQRMQFMMDFFNYFNKLTADRRANPSDDVASVIANAVMDGKPIGEMEALGYYVIVATAGHDTTSASTAGGLLALMQNPEQMKKLRNDISLLPQAIEEMFRWETPVKHFLRTATEDYTLRGKSIKEGDRLMMMYASGNRDEDVFDNPFEFQIDRRPNKQIAFGFGVHRCLGHLLAKMEMNAFYKALLEKTTDIQLNGDPAWVHATFVSGLKRLPVRFTPK